MAYLIQPLPTNDDRALVFGLRWASTISANPEKEARQAARRAKAAYYTRARSRSTVVGMLTLDARKDRPNRKTGLFSAAAAFARSHERGTVAVCLVLPDAQVWVAACKDGMVLVGSDIIYPSLDAAQEQLDQLRSTHPDLQVLGNREGDTAPADGFLTENLTDSTRLRRTTFTLADISTGAWLLLGAFAALTAWHYASQWYEQRQQALLDASRMAEPVDPVVAWKETLAQWEKSQRMHGMPGLQAILATAASLPVYPGRWELAEIDCRPAQCTAAYKRTRLADNPSLRQALGEDIAIQFSDLDTASISVPVGWRAIVQANIGQMPATRDLQSSLFVRWQQLRPALDDLRIGPRVPAVITAPLGPNADGNLAPLTFPTQAGLVYPQTQEVSINAPLRSMSYVDLPAQSQILQLHIRPASTTSPDLRSSVLHATLKGIIYVQ